MAAPLRRQVRTFVPDMLDILDPVTSFLPLAMGQTFRIEDAIADGRYVVRAELPGVDPDKDVEVTVADGTLQIHVERHDGTDTVHYSEFRYGPMTRTLRLPADADTKAITARYDRGILEIGIELTEPKTASRRITIQTAG